MSLKWYCYFSLNYICWDIPRFLVVLGVEVLWFVFCRWLTFLKLQIFHQMSSTFPRSESIGKYVENTNPRGKFWEHQKRITNLWDLFISRELIIKWTLLWAILGISPQHYVVHTLLSFDDATVFTLLGWKVNILKIHMRLSLEDTHFHAAAIYILFHHQEVNLFACG